MIPREQITGIVLCGGEGRRMGGIDKPLALLHGRPLVAHVLDRLAPQVGSVIVSANRSLDAYRALGHPVVSDTTPGLGPLGGIVSALAQVETPWAFCCPGDAPLLHTGLVSRLADAVADQDAIFPDDGERAQHLFVLLRRALAGPLGRHLADGARSVREVLAEFRCIKLAAADIRESFRNVNTADALRSVGIVIDTAAGHSEG